MLAQRRRRWANIKTASGQHIVFAVNAVLWFRVDVNPAQTGHKLIETSVWFFVISAMLGLPSPQPRLFYN